MPVAVVKLGSSIVAEDAGELRLVRGRARSARRSPRCTAPASTWSSSPRARSPAGCTCSRCRVRPSAIEELQAASAVGQGRLYRTYDELLRERGIQTAQVLLTFFDMSARTHYVNARRTLRKLLEWRIVPVINENDTTTTDEISFGDNDFLAAQVAVLVGRRAARAADRHRRALHRRPARSTPTRELVRRGRRPRGARGAARSATRSRRSARAGCARRSSRPRWRRGGHPDGDRQRAASPACSRARGRARRRARASRRSRCATRASSCGSSTPSPSRGTVDGRRGRRAGAARGRHVSLLPVGIVEVDGAFDAGDAVEVARRDGAARSARGSATTPPPSCARSWA